MNEAPGLRTGSLPFVQVLAISIALVGPTMTPVLIAPFMYGTAGNGAWLAYLLGGIMLLFVALNLNQFTRRSSSTGSMFTNIAESLGERAGSLGGWTLLWCYLLVAAAVTGAMTLFVQQLLEGFGLHLPASLLMVVLAATVWLLAYRGVQLSAVVMLAFEAMSVTLVCVLIAKVFLKDSILDPAQIHLEGASWSAVGLGTSVAIFSLVGFESATAFGEEAREPQVAIPRAVFWSVVIASAFFILAAYAEILGLRRSPTPMDKLEAPLTTLAELLQVGYLRIPITVGAFVSAFSVCLACISTSARILMAMARKGRFPATLAAVQASHRTPHVATSLASGVSLVVGGLLLGSHVALVDIFNYCGSLSSCGFIVIYALIAVAAPLYLRRSGQLRRRDVVLSVLALVFLVIPAVTFFYPPPTPPTQLFPYLFLGYTLLGAIWFEWRARGTSPGGAVAG